MGKKKLYYGWFVVAGVFIACGMMMYMSVNSFSLFVTPVTEKLGITATAFLVCATVSSLGGMISGPVGGRLLDSKGARFTATVFAAVMTIGFLVLAMAQNLFLFYIGYFLAGIGSGPITSIINTVCSRWFIKKRGLANGIANAGNGFISLILSPVIASVIISGGYSRAYMLIMGILLIFGVGAAFLLIRDDPGLMGLLPDGAAEETGQNVNRAMGGSTEGLTMSEIYKTRSFWLMSVGFGAFTLCSLGIVRTWNAVFQSQGINAVTVAFAVSVYGIACIPAKMIFGALTDKLPLKAVTVIGFGIFAAAASLPGFFGGSSLIQLYLFAIAFAIGNSSWQSLFMKYVVNCFGMKSIGTVSGIISVFMNVGGMIGPLIAGTFFDISGSYRMAYQIFAVITILACGMVVLCRKETSN